MKNKITFILGTLAGLLLAVGGTAYAATILFPHGGGTGTGTVPSYGEVLVGQSNGTYLPQATSTLGISGGTGGSGVATTSLLATSPLTVTKTSASITYGIPAANTSTNGYLSSTDWNTFNNKQGAITLTTTGTSGAATFISNTLNIPNYANTTYTATYPITLTGTAFGSALSTTTSQTWSGTNTFSTLPVLGSLSGLVAGNAGSLYQVSTTSMNASITGNAGTATKLATARTIAGVSFDGTANISLNNNAITNGAGYTTNTGTVTSVAATVPTGLSISGSPITTSGTLALSYATGYAAVKTASTTNWNGFYDTPSTRITAGTNLSWSGNTLNATGGGTFSWTPTTNYGAAANSTSTPIWFKSGIQASTTANYFAGLTIDNGSASNAWATYGKSGHEWSEGYNATGNYFEISSSTTLGTNDVFKADKNLNVFFPNLSTNGLLYTSGGTGQLTVISTSTAVDLSISGNAGTATKLATARTIAGVAFDGTANISLNNNAITNGAGYITSITGGTCTNQFVRSLSTAGAVTCATVANTDLANSTISGISLGSNLNALTATNGTLTFSGSYNGSTARTIGLNLGNANTWTALQQFGNATSTQFSAGSSNQFYINSAGEVTAYDTIYSHTGQLNPMRPLSIDVSTTTTWTGTSTTASLYGDMAAMVAPWTGTITKASCFTDAGTATIELTSGANSTYLPNASTTAGINTFSLAITKGDKMYLQAGHPASSMNRANCTFTGYITP